MYPPNCKVGKEKFENSKSKIQNSIFKTKNSFVIFRKIESVKSDQLEAPICLKLVASWVVYLVRLILFSFFLFVLAANKQLKEVLLAFDKPESEVKTPPPARQPLIDLAQEKCNKF